MFKLIMITNQPAIARYVSERGVDRVFVDLELNGKEARQGHLDTVLSGHTLDDVRAVRAAIPGRELLVRVNPLFEGTGDEVAAAVAAGADLLMLPMCRTADEVARFVAIVAGRARVVPLVETPEAADVIGDIAALDGVDEVYIGLNDLHLGLGSAFMFEPLADGLLDRMVAAIRPSGRPFGFGGVGARGQGALPAHMILAEHARLGSSSVILGRTFHHRARTVDELAGALDFAAEVRWLREAMAGFAARGEAEVQADRDAARERIHAIAADVRARQCS